jgi:demethylmenaquinone methyltransferase/2-methoxy-6-polyprenyl-1,4-benzoquinol methylase
VASQEKTEIWKMFDRIAGRYDLLNRLLSMRQDVLWRKKLLDLLPKENNLQLLDVATGTADQILHLLEETKEDKIGKATGIDMSENMLAEGQKKISHLNLDGKVTLRVGDATQIPFKNDEFDVSTMSFGIRNVINVDAALKETYRVLRPGGTCLILEFSLPKNKLIRKPYLFYFRNVLPKVGSLISGDRQAYGYLNSSVEEFPYGDAFLKLMQNAGFEKTECFPLSMGIASIYKGVKKLNG